MFDFFKRKKIPKKCTFNFDISEDALLYMFSFLDIKELCSKTCLVNKQFKNLIYKLREKHRNKQLKLLRNIKPRIGDEYCSWHYKAVIETLYCHTEDELDEKIRYYEPETKIDNLNILEKALVLHIAMKTSLGDKIRYKFTRDITNNDLLHSISDTYFLYYITIPKIYCDIFNNIKVIGQYNKIYISNGSSRSEISNNFMFFPVNAQYQTTDIEIVSREKNLKIEFDCAIFSRNIRRNLVIRSIYNHTTEHYVRAGTSNPVQLNEITELLK